MRWIVSLFVVLAACGGPQIPAHNGYKPKEAKPWKKPKVLKFDDKLETKSEGSVSYPDMRRAKWYEVTLPSSGQLTVTLEITPPGDGVNDDFDLAMEVFDPQSRVVAKSDLEENDAHELTKKKTLVDLLPGKYLIHVYLQSLLDTADFVMHASFKATAGAEVKSDYPAQVAFTPTLPQVPLQDDTPKNYRPPTAKPVVITHTGHKPPPPPPPPPAATVTARIIGIQVVGDRTVITVGRGTASGAANGMKGQIGGISANFEIANCTERTCSASIKATPDQIKNSNGMVTLSP